MKALKYFGIAIGALLALVLVLVLAVALLFDPNDYREELQRTAQQRMGRNLTLEGDLRLAWFPWLALEAGPASIGNAEGFEGGPLLRVERMRLGLKLRTLLLQRRLEFDTVRLERPVLRLSVDAAGRNNWSGLFKETGEASGPAEGSPLLRDTRISSLRLTGGRLEYRDARDTSAIDLVELAFETGALQAGTPFDLKARFDWGADAATALGVGIEARAVLDLPADRYRFETPRIALQMRGQSLPKEGLPVSVRSGPIEIDLAAQSLRMPDLLVEAVGAQLSGELVGTRIIDAPSFTGPLRLAKISPREILRAFGIVAPVTRNAQALSSMSFAGQLAATPKAVELLKLVLTLDDVNAKGSAGIADLDAMAIRFDLDVDRLQLDDYLAPAPAPAPAPAAAAADTSADASSEGVGAKDLSAGKGGAPLKIPVELLRNLDLVGRLKIGDAVVSGVPLAGLDVGIDARKSRLRLFPLEAALYGGRYRGDLRVDVTGQPRVDFDETVTGIDFAPLCRDLLDSRRISGRGTGSIRGTARGADLDVLLRTADGAARLQVADGAVEGADLWYEIRRARALLRREAPPVRAPGPARTPFIRLQATGRLAEGTLRSDDVAMDMQYLRVSGRGAVDLVAETVDWKLDAKVLKIPSDEASMSEVVDFTIPVKVTGPVDDPVVRPDLAGLAKARVQQEIDKRRDEVKEKVQDKVRDTLRDLLGR